MKTLQIPSDCLPSFREVWEDYRSIARLDGELRVLDIGANVGAFSLMAKDLWPGCVITAYEPNPELFPHLENNIGDFASCVRLAVRALEGPLRLLNDGPNRMCGSVVRDGYKAGGVLVDVMPPTALDYAEIVKIDIEGGESEVIAALPFTPVLLMVEYHTEQERQRICATLDGKMVLISCKVANLGLGVMHFWKL